VRYDNGATEDEFRNTGREVDSALETAEDASKDHLHDPGAAEEHGDGNAVDRMETEVRHRFMRDQDDMYRGHDAIGHCNDD